MKEKWQCIGNETGYTVTVLTEEYQKYKEELELAGVINGTMKYWR